MRGALLDKSRDADALLEILQMRNQLYLPRRLRADGYTGVENSFWKDLLKEVAVLILLAAFIIAITLFVLIDPFEFFAPPLNDTHQVTGASIHRKGAAAPPQSLNQTRTS